MGEVKTERALNIFFKKYHLPENTERADARLINFSEKLLTGSIGNASAKILISNVIKEEEISLVEVLKILDESKENISNNKKLTEQSKELQKLTNKLKVVNEELIIKDKQKDDFLDTIAHEIKTPLTGIRAATELLLDSEDEMPDELKQNFLNNILQDTDRLARMINNILDFEKLATNRISLLDKQNDIKTSIEKTLSSINQIAIQKNITLKYQPAESALLYYDEDRIIQVLTNLFSNALKFCNKEKGEICISSIKNKDFIEIAIEDNGTGIPEQDIHFIFEKFYQTKNQNIKKPQGSGLGLAICKQIIDKHNGEIWVENTEKSGARFYFKLPLKK